MTFSSGGPPFVALVSLSNKGEIQYTGVDARCPTPSPTREIFLMQDFPTTLYVFIDYILTDKEQTFKTSGTFSWDRIKAILQKADTHTHTDVHFSRLAFNLVCG